MLLVVDVSGKKYIVETEDYQDLSSKKEDTMSRGYPKIKRNVCIIFLLRLWNELDWNDRDQFGRIRWVGS